MLDHYLERIKTVYPNIETKHYEQNEMGQNNDVLIINHTLVFRFPKYRSGINQLKRETELLKAINKEVNIKIPDPIYCSFEQNKVGMVFSGYNLIEGTPLQKTMLQKLEKTQKRSLALELVTFLKQLHNVTDNRVYDIIKHQEKDARQVFSELYVEIKNNLFTYMSDDKKDEVTSLFCQALSNPDLLRYTPKLIHGDFGSSNILWDCKTYKLTGIIDFGATRLGDPAYDFAGILSSYGEEFFNLCLRLYGEDKLIKERVTFYKSTFALQEALHGFINNDKEAFENGMKLYKKTS